MKRLPLGILLAALATGYTNYLLAADINPAKNPEPPAQQTQHEEHEHKHRNFTENRLIKLQQQLHLKDNQQAAWAQYKAFILTNNNEHHERHGPAEHEELPAPEALKKFATHLREQADNLDKLSKETDTFYKILSPEQKTIFDLHWQSFHGRGHHKP